MFVFFYWSDYTRDLHVVTLSFPTRRPSDLTGGACPQAAPASHRSTYLKPVLYSFRRCPYAMRARLAIAASGCLCELREVVLRNKPPSLLAVSPKATVPVDRKSTRLNSSH